MKVNRRSTPPLNEFDENDYDGERLLIGGFLNTMMTGRKRVDSRRRHTNSSYEAGKSGDIQRSGMARHSG